MNPDATNPDAVLAGIARDQYSLVETGQAGRHGISAQILQTRLELGVFERVHKNVLRLAGTPVTWEQRALAACLSAGPDAAASHRAAARLWDIDHAPGDPIDIVMSRARAVKLAGVFAHRTADLDADDVTVHCGIPVTIPARTLVDLGAVSPKWAVDRAIDRALSKRLVTLPELWRGLAKVARRGRNGAGVLRECLAWRVDVPDSVLEGLFLKLVSEFDLPRPAVQYWVTINGRRYRIDAAYPDRLLAIELDGAETHATASALEADLQRQNDLVAAGWTILRFIWRDLTVRRGETARRVRGAYERLAVLEQVSGL